MNPTLCLMIVETERSLLSVQSERGWQRKQAVRLERRCSSVSVKWGFAYLRGMLEIVNVTLRCIPVESIVFDGAAGR